MALGMETHRDWFEWHSPYADPDSPLSRRLLFVKRLLRSALLDCADSEPGIISICAGQGADVIEVLDELPAGFAPRARLVELDPQNVRAARTHAAKLDLSERVSIHEGDAASLEQYADVAPANVVLACGVFGNIADQDIYATIDLLPQLCKGDATVIWTRSRRAPDLTPSIRAYFQEQGFAEVEFIAPEDVEFTVGCNRYTNEPQPLDSSARMFTFSV